MWVPDQALPSRVKNIMEIIRKSSGQMEKVIVLGLPRQSDSEYDLRVGPPGTCDSTALANFGEITYPLQFSHMEDRNSTYQSIHEDCFGDCVVMHVKCIIPVPGGQ